MLPIKPALQNFPSGAMRDQFDKVFSVAHSIPTSPKTHELRTRNKEVHPKTASQTEKQADQR
jgi:hypothetical protein